MNSSKAKRQRGVVLTAEGYQRLWQAQLESELQANDGDNYTYEEISERTGLDNGTIRRVLGRQEGVDKRSIIRLFKGFDLLLEESDYTKPCPAPIVSEGICRRRDLQPKVDTSTLCGRSNELARLRQYILNDRCRLVALLGMGGIGKTALAAKLVEQIGDGFEYVFWRSLRDALPIEILLIDFIQLMADDKNIAVDLPDKSTAHLLQLFSQYLRKSRCLLVLDNFETVLYGGKRVGEYCDGCEEYGQLLRLIGEIEHDSCLIVTSREKPREVAYLEGAGLTIRSVRLQGLESRPGQRLLELKKLLGSEKDYQRLINVYAGNPLALKIVSTTIQDLFDGDVTEFLSQKTAIFGDIRSLLDQQFERLTELELCLMYWLVINREPVSLSDLQKDIAIKVSVHALLEALESLVRRFLIEKGAKSFTLQPVVMEYVTTCYIERICQEIVTQELDLFHSHTLIKATGKDYIQDIQKRMILIPLNESLCETLKSKGDIQRRLFDIIKSLQREAPTAIRYAVGNAINLLCWLGTDFTGCDFSDLFIRQADLRCANLRRVNFNNVHFQDSLFSETFGGVLSVALSPDGQTLATGDTNGNIFLREVYSTKKQLWITKAHSRWIPEIEFSPDGKTLVTSSTDYMIKLWDVETGVCLKIFEGHQNEVWAVGFSPDGKTLASGSDDYSIKLWDISSGKCIRSLEHASSYVFAIAFSPDGQTLASGGRDNRIRLWNVQSGQCFKILQGHDGPVRSVAYSSDGSKLASGSEDHTIKLWDLKQGKCIATFRGHSNHVFSVVFNETGNQLVSGSLDQSVKLWDVVSKKCSRTFHGHSDIVLSVSFDSRNQLIASGSRDQTVRLWNAFKGECLRIYRGNSNQFNFVVFSPDGQMLATGSQDHKLRLWNVSSGQIIKTLEGHQAAVETIAFSSDGQILATGSSDRTIRLWNRDTASPLRILEAHQDGVKSIIFSPDDRLLASGSGDTTVRLWDIETGRMLHVLDQHQTAIWSLAFSPCGNRLVSGASEGSAIVWDVNTGQFLAKLEGHENWVWSLDWSLDNRFIASVSPDGTLRLWSTDDYQCLRTFRENNGWLHSIAFSPDSQTLAGGHQNFALKLWSTKNLETLRTFEGHTGLTWSIAFNQNGNLLASGSEDETVRLWDIETGQCLKTLRAPRLYENMTVQNVKGLSDSVLANLKALGACWTTAGN